MNSFLPLQAGNLPFNQFLHANRPGVDCIYCWYTAFDHCCECCTSLNHTTTALVTIFTAFKHGYDTRIHSHLCNGKIYNLPCVNLLRLNYRKCVDERCNANTFCRDKTENRSGAQVTLAQITLLERITVIYFLSKIVKRTNLYPVRYTIPS